MAKRLLVELKCDYCDTKLTFPAPVNPGDQPPPEAGSWIVVVHATGEQQFFDRSGCAVNGLKLRPTGVIVPGTNLPVSEDGHA